MRIRPLFLIVLFCCVAALAVVYQPWHRPAAPYTGPPPDSRVVAAHTAFGFDLLHELASKPGENVFISPSSIATALEMTNNGAGGRTKAEMAKTLHVDGISLDVLNQSNEALRLGAVGADPKVEIAIANSLWAQDGYPFLPAFMERNKRYYAAEVRNVNFGQPATSKRINSWVEQRTNSKIKNLVGNLDSLTHLVLVNAVYFRAPWKDKFKSQNTRREPFTLQDGSTRTVPMMSQLGFFGYRKGGGFKAIRMPYASGHFAMYVFLPDAKDGLPELLNKISVAKWRTWIRGMRTEEVSLGLPRFHAEYTQALNEPLKALGMPSAFSPEAADFRGMTGKRELFISLVQHKAFVEVNEEGTSAAAATMAEKVLGIPVAFVVDHPFLCAIRDDQTGEILFLGAIYNPA